MNQPRPLYGSLSTNLYNGMPCQGFSCCRESFVLGRSEFSQVGACVPSLKLTANAPENGMSIGFPLGFMVFIMENHWLVDDSR